MKALRSLRVAATAPKAVEATADGKAAFSHVSRLFFYIEQMGCFGS